MAYSSRDPRMAFSGRGTHGHAWPVCRTGRVRAGPPTITARKRAQIVALTLKPSGPGMTHRSTRDLDRRAGVSYGAVHRPWRAHAFKPDRISTFEFTPAPAAEDNIYDVVGLYLDPPTNVVGVIPERRTG